MKPIAVVFALVTGGSLGLVGGGGSILTVPVLVFALGFEPRAAVAASLVVVGVTGLAGALAHWRHGTLSPRVALTFGALGAVGAAIGSRVGQHLPGEWLMLGFTAVTFAAGIAMLRQPPAARAADAPRPRRGAVVAASALGVGFLTGLFGVGGGFLIVPALVLAVGLPMATAVGTSLAVIAANCAAGLLASWRTISAPEIPVIATFTLLSVAGSVLGASAARRTRPALLRLAFGGLVLVVGLYTGARSVLALAGL